MTGTRAYAILVLGFASSTPSGAQGVRVAKDLSNRDRVVTGTKKPLETSF